MKRTASLFLVMCLLLCGCSQVADVEKKETDIPKSEVSTREKEIIFKKSDESIEEEEQGSVGETEERESPTENPSGFLV